MHFPLKKLSLNRLLEWGKKAGAVGKLGGRG